MFKIKQMITISQHVEQWIEQNPVMRDQLAMGLMNHSALARHMYSDIKNTAGTSVSIEAITIALNRLGKALSKQPRKEDLLRFIGDVSVQTGLTIIVIQTEPNDLKTGAARRKGEFFVVSQGIWHTTIMSKTETIDMLGLAESDVVVRRDNLTGLTVKLTSGNVDVPGVCSLVLQVLANKNINLQEVSSTHDELTVIFDQDEAQKALQTIIDLKTFRSN